jgi:hypothetical protein
MENKPSTFMVSLGYGAIIALAIVVFSLITFLLNMQDNKGLQSVSYIILLGGIILSQINYRNKYMGGFISYGKVFTVGTLISLVLGIIMGIYTFIFFKYIDPGAMEEVMTMQEQALMDRGMTDMEIEQSMAIASKFAGVGMYTFFALLGNFIIGVIFSLITSIFIKKEDTGFGQPSV